MSPVLWFSVATVEDSRQILSVVSRVLLIGLKLCGI